MNKTTLLAVGIAAILLAAGVGYIFLINNDDGTDGDIVDGAGRNVSIPANLDNGIVTVGSSDPLRFVSYFNMNDHVIQVDKGDVTDPKNGRAYSYAYDYTGLPFHDDNALSNETTERIGKLNPSLVIIQNSIYDAYTDNAELLAKLTCVVVLYEIPNPMFDGEFKLVKEFTDQLDMLGKIFGKESRADELRDGMNGMMREIRDNVSGIADDRKIYVAGLTYMGSNALTSTFPTYAPLMLVGGNNAYYEPGNAGKVDLTVEQVAALDIDVMIIDPSSCDQIAGNNNSQGVMHYINGLNSDGDPNNDIKLYTIIPIVWDNFNFDCILACAYYLQYILYDIGTMEEAVSNVNKVFELFYGNDGTDVLDQMSQFFVGKSTQAGMDMPLMNEVKITGSQGNYRFEKV